MALPPVIEVILATGVGMVSKMSMSSMPKMLGTMPVITREPAGTVMLLLAALARMVGTCPPITSEPAAGLIAPPSVGANPVIVSDATGTLTTPPGNWKLVTALELLTPARCA